MTLKTRFSFATCAISALALAFSNGGSVARAGDRPVLKPIPDARFTSVSGVDQKTSRPRLFEVVEHLSPRLDKKSLRYGVSLAIVYATIPKVPEGFYMVRLYADGDRHLVTMVDRQGIEIPVDLLGLESHVQFCKPEENEIEGCWGEEGECIVECDHESSFCVQTCLVPYQWPPEWPPLPSPPE